MSGLRLNHYQVYGRLHKHVEHFAPSQNTEVLCSCAITQPKIKLLFHFARTSPSRQVVSESLDGLQNVAELLQIYFLFYWREGEAPISRKLVVLSANPSIKQCGSPTFFFSGCMFERRCFITPVSSSLFSWLHHHRRHHHHQRQHHQHHYYFYFLSHFAYSRAETHLVHCKKTVKLIIFLETRCGDVWCWIIVKMHHKILTHCNTMPAVRRAGPSMPLLLILAFCQ